LPGDVQVELRNAFDGDANTLKRPIFTQLLVCSDEIFVDVEAEAFSRSA
jgi:hypothetical protein